MAKVTVGLRLSPETLEWLDAAAAARGTSRQRLMECAVALFRLKCRDGAPVLVPPGRVR